MTFDQRFLDAAAFEYQNPILERPDYRERSFMETVITSVKLQPFYQMLDPANLPGWNFERDPEYDPYEDMGEYRAHSWHLRNAISADHMVAMKNQIDRNQVLRQEEARHGSWKSMLFAELWNPINYIPMPALAGAGIVKGAAFGGLSNFAYQEAEEGLRLAMDPTSTEEEIRQNLFYGLVFGTALGGAVGKFGQWTHSRMDLRATRQEIHDRQNDAVFEGTRPHRLPESHQNRVREKIEPDFIVHADVEGWTPAHESMLYSPGWVRFVQDDNLVKTSMADPKKFMEFIDTNNVANHVFQMYKRLHEVIPARSGQAVSRGYSLDFEDMPSHRGGYHLAESRLIRLATHENPANFKSILDHEMVHALRQMGLFSSREWEMLRERARTNWVARYKIRDRYADNYKNLGPDEYERALEEEAIAEAFSEWVQRPDRSPADAQTRGMFRNWYKAFKDMMKNLRKKVKDDQKLGRIPENIGDIFDAIDRGEFKRRAETYGTLDMDFGINFRSVEGARPVQTTPLDAGAKKIGGFENIVQYSYMGSLVQSGSRALADLAMKMAFDYDFALERNRGGAEASPQSAFLYSGMWQAGAIDAIRGAQEHFVEYLTDGATKGTMFGSINIAATAERIRNSFGRGTDGKMTYSEFMSEVSTAFTADGIAHADPHVKAAAEKLDVYYKKAADEGYANGIIPSRAGWMKRVSQNEQTLSNIQGQMAALEEAASGRPMTGREQIKHERLQAWFNRLTEQTDQIKALGIDSYEGTEEIVQSILEWGQNKSRAQLDRARQIELNIAHQVVTDLRLWRHFALKQEQIGLSSRETGYFNWLSNRYSEYTGLLRDPEINLDEIIDAFGDELSEIRGSQAQRDLIAKLREWAEDPLTQRQKTYLDDLRAQQRAFWEPELTERPQAYLPLVYDLQAIADDYARGADSVFLQKVIRKFTETAHLRGFSTEPDSIELRARDWIENELLNMKTDVDGVDVNYRNSTNGVFRWMRQRKIGFTHDEIADFVDTDADRITRDYGMAFGIGVEFAKMFGDRGAEDAIDDALIKSIDEFDNGSYDHLKREIAKREEQLIRLRDLTLGDRNRRHPLTWDKYAADGLRSWAAATMLGRVIKTVIPETAHVMMVNGLSRTFGFAFENLGKNLEGFKAAKADLQPWTIEGMDMAAATAAQRLVNYLENHGPAKSELLNKIQGSRVSQAATSFAHGPLYMMNLLAPATEAMKTFQLVMSSHRFIDDIVTGADPERLASHGFTPEAISSIRAMVEDGTIQKSDNLWQANVGDWTDGALRAQYMAAVSGEVRRVVVMAGPGHKRDFMDGYWGKPGSQTRFALGALPFQFMQFSMGAMTKYTLSAAQGRDASPLAGLVALVGLGYISTWMKVPDWAWDQMPAEERLLRSVEASGALAVFGDLPAMLEQATANQYGIRPLLGLDAKFPVNDQLDQASLLWGPGGDKVADLYRLFIAPDTSARDRARYLRRAIPLNDLVYWHHLFLEADPYTEQVFDEIY